MSNRPSLLGCMKLCLFMFGLHMGGCNLSDVHNFSLANVGPVSCSECQCAWGIDAVSVFAWDYRNEEEMCIYKHNFTINGSHGVVSYKSIDLGPTCWQASKKTPQYLFVLNQTHHNASDSEASGRQLQIIRIEIVQGVFNAVSPYVLPLVQLQCHGSEKSEPLVFPLSAGKNSLFLNSSVTTLKKGTWQLSGWERCSHRCKPGTRDAIFDCVDEAGYPAICSPPKPTQTKPCNDPPVSENGFPIHENVAWSFRDAMSQILFLLPGLFIVSLIGCTILLCWAFDTQNKDGWRKRHVQIYGKGRFRVMKNMLVHHLMSAIGTAFGFFFLQSGSRRGGSLATSYCGPPESDPKDNFNSIMWITLGLLFHVLASVMLSGWFHSTMRNLTTEGRGIGGSNSAIHGMVQRDGRKVVQNFRSLQALQRFDLLSSIQAARPVMVDAAIGAIVPAPEWHTEGFALDQARDALARYSGIYGLVEVKIQGDWCDDDPDSVELDLSDTRIRADMVYYDIQYFDDQDRIALIPFTIQSRTHAFFLQAMQGYAMIFAHFLLIGPLVAFWLYINSVEVRIYFRKVTEKHPEYEMGDIDTLGQDLEEIFGSVPFAGTSKSLSEVSIGSAQIAKVERWLQGAYDMHWRINRRHANEAFNSDDQSSVKQLLKRSSTTSLAEVPIPGLCMEGEEDTQPSAYRSASAPSPSSSAKQSLLLASESHQYDQRWSKELLKLDHLIDRGVEVLVRWYAQFLDGQPPGKDESICGGEQAFGEILVACHGIWNAGRTFRRDEKWAGVLEAMRRHLCIQTCQALARWDVDQVIQLRESIEALGAGVEDVKLCEMQYKLGSLRLETAIDAVHLGDLQVQEHLATAIIQAELLTGGAVLKALPQDEQDRLTELLSNARKMYKERLYHDVQRIICTKAVKELLGEGQGANPDMVIERLALADLNFEGRFPSGSFRIAWQDLLESKSIIQQVQLLFDQTSDDVVTRDRRGDDIPSRLEVVKVKRSVNMDIYKPYFARRAAITETISELGDVGLNLQGARTIALTGCWLDGLLVNAQGVWRDGLSGELWIIRGSAALKLCNVLLHDESTSIRQRDWPKNLVVESIGSTSDEKESRIRWTRKGAVDASKLPDLRDSSKDCVSLAIHELPDTPASSLRDVAACLNEEEILSGHVSTDGQIVWKSKADDGSEVEVCKWFRETALLGDWLIDNGHAAVAHRSTFLEAAELAGRSRWASKDLAAMDKMVKEKSECKPDLVMLICQQFHPIWQDAPDTFRSVLFSGRIVDARQLELTFFKAEKIAGNLGKSDDESPTKCAFRQAASVRLSHEPLKAKAQELWLFHGTREYAAEQIMDKDFTLKLTGSHRGTMFGPGIYLADSVTKSDEYTEEDESGLRTMLMCRCIMGRTLEQDAMSVHGHDCMRKCLRHGFHSTLGKRAYDEYVVYDENQVYPEYLVWYRREMRG